MQVRCGEGLAIHIGPEPCVTARKGRGEASVGECIGQPSSRDSLSVLGADAVKRAEGHTTWCAIASAGSTRRGRRPWHVQKLLEREPGGPASDRQNYATPVRIGKVRSRSR